MYLYKIKMVKFTNKIGLSIIVVVYLLATLGFSVHTCLCAHESEIILPWCELLSCDLEADSSSDDCCSSECDCHHENKGCCTTETFVVDDSCLTCNNDKMEFSLNSLFAFYIPVFAENTFLNDVVGYSSAILGLDLDAPPLERNIIIEVAQYRL